MTKDATELEKKTLEDLSIEDEPSFEHVALYADLKEILRRDRYPFRVLPPSSGGRWDRALLLNLTFWASGEGGDVLVDERIAADVVAHAAWHHLAARELRPTGARPGAPPSAEALFLGEAIASAFDVYLVGRLLGHAPGSSFLESQVPAMADAADAAGVPEGDLEALLRRIADDPERAFEDLRQLLFDTTGALFLASDATAALAVLERSSAHPFGPLLHRYELSNWVLYARAYAGPPGKDEPARVVDATLRASEGALSWLTAEWVTPALGRVG